MVQPYTRVSIAWIASELNIAPPEVEQLLVTLILDGRIDGQIDQIGQLLLLRRTPAEAKKFQAIGKWAGTLGTLQQAVLTKLA